MTTITQSDIADVTGMDDNASWTFYTKYIRPSDSGTGIITTKKERKYPVAGVLTVSLDPGPAVVTAPDGNSYPFTVPATGSELWPLIQAAVTIPPATTHQQLVDAIDAWLAAHPAVTVTSVKDFGAVGNGVANDTAAIHAARDAAGVGGRVFFPPGFTYLAGALSANVAGQTWLMDGATLKFAGPGSVDFLTITALNVTMVRGTLDLSSVTKNPAAWQSNGTLVRSSGSGAVIRDVTVKDSPGHGIWALDANNVTVTGCTVTDQEFYGIYVSTSADSVHIHDYLIHGNLISTSSTRGKGIYLRNDNNTRSISRARIANNTVILPFGSAASAEALECIVAFYSFECVVDSNILIGGWAGISVPYSTRFAISNNVARGFWGIGIEIPGAQTDVTVTGNTVDADGHGEAEVSGIQCSESAVKNVTIAGNSISGFTVGPCHGIFFGSGSQLNGVVVVGNTITSAVSSGQFTGIESNDGITNLTVTGNVIDAASTASSRGISLHSGAVTGVAITGNSLSNLATAALGLYVLTTGTFANIRFTGNLVRNCGAATDGDGFTAGTNIVLDIAPEIHAATGKTTPVDADELPIVDSAASNVLKKLTFANLKAWFKSYYDSVTTTMDNKTLTAPKISSGAGVAAPLDLQTSGSNRWTIRKTSAAESSTYTGSNLELIAYDNSGGGASKYFEIIRDTGIARFIYGITLDNTSTSTGSVVTVDGTQTETNKTFTAPKISSGGAPASAGAAGVAGQIAWDSGFIYVCTATNTWKRVAIATW